MTNFCTFIGRLGADPETRYIETKGGGSAPLVTFSLACDQFPDDKPLWVDVTVWDERLQGFAAKHLKKGSGVAIAGKLSAKPYKTKDGEPRSGLSLKAERIEFVGGKKQEDGQQSSGGYTDYSTDAF